MFKSVSVFAENVSLVLSVQLTHLADMEPIALRSALDPNVLVWFCGPSGSGKTHAIQEQCQAQGLLYVNGSDIGSPLELFSSYLEHVGLRDGANDDELVMPKTLQELADNAGGGAMIIIDHIDELVQRRPEASDVIWQWGNVLGTGCVVVSRQPLAPMASTECGGAVQVVQPSPTTATVATWISPWFGTCAAMQLTQALWTLTHDAREMVRAARMVNNDGREPLDPKAMDVRGAHCWAAMVFQAYRNAVLLDARPELVDAEDATRWLLIATYMCAWLGRSNLSRVWFAPAKTRSRPRLPRLRWQLESPARVLTTDIKRVWINLLRHHHRDVATLRPKAQQDRPWAKLRTDNAMAERRDRILRHCESTFLERLDDLVQRGLIHRCGDPQRLPVLDRGFMGLDKPAELTSWKRHKIDARSFVVVDSWAELLGFRTVLDGIINRAGSQAH